CMQAQRINITLPQKIAKQLQSSIPQGQRSHFIARVIEENLGNEQNKVKLLRKSLEANYEYDKKIGKEWKATELERWPD
ncbi:MAG: hypothetical protein AAB504_00140, partial [Patescibacteria group bacterium]